MIFGDSADRNDFWFRVLTNTDHVKNGKIHHSAFKGAAAISPPDEKRAWSHEMSGRLRSLAGDPTAEGYAFVDDIRNRKLRNNEIVPAKIQFSGFMAGEVARIAAKLDSGPEIDVIYTPTATDNAHADIAIFNSSDAELDTVRGYLINGLHFVAPNKRPGD